MTPPASFALSDLGWLQALTWGRRHGWRAISPMSAGSGPSCTRLERTEGKTLEFVPYKKPVPFWFSPKKRLKIAGLRGVLPLWVLEFCPKFSVVGMITCLVFFGGVELCIIPSRNDHISPQKWHEMSWWFSELLPEIGGICIHPFFLEGIYSFIVNVYMSTWSSRKMTTPGPLIGWIWISDLGGFKPQEREEAKNGCTVGVFMSWEK